jgi:hypothetical protein
LLLSIGKIDQGRITEQVENIWREKKFFHWISKTLCMYNQNTAVNSCNH